MTNLVFATISSAQRKNEPWGSQKKNEALGLSMTRKSQYFINSRARRYITMTVSAHEMSLSFDQSNTTRSETLCTISNDLSLKNKHYGCVLTAIAHRSVLCTLSLLVVGANR